MRRGTADTALWVRRYHPAPVAPKQLVCFPHAGGSASFYFPVARALSPAVDVLAVQYPGRQDRRREPCIEEIPAMADAVTEALRPAIDRPVALFGHSMGAVIAFEVATRLEQARTTPLVALFVSGRRAPSRFREETVHLHGDDVLLADVAALSGTNTQVMEDEELVRMVLPAIRSDYRAAETYRWAGGGPLVAPIHAHVGDTDTRAEVPDVRAWAEHTSGEFTLTTYPGGHFYLNDYSDQLVAAIAATLTKS